MKEIFVNVIESGKFDLTDMLKKIDTHHICGNLTDEEREELIVMARQKASAEHSTDVFAKLLELEQRVTALESGNAPAVSDTPDEYTAGKWYHNGDKATFNGKVYTCIAPEGAVCTWSPAEYPAYWD